MLLGSTMGNFFRAVRYGRIEPRYYHKVFFTGLICLFATPFHLWESIREGKSNEEAEPPVFIIGHWRSGTTFLHNLLCQDPNTSYVTTYQSVFPNNMHSKLLFKTFMSAKMPDQRPSDNVKLAANYPQEDDFALANILPAFYEFFYFPDAYKDLFSEIVLFENVEEKAIEDWQVAYKKLINKARVNIGGKNIVLKNPVNTARVAKLIELYPKARFIHIYRNPVIVYLSTKKFFLALFPTIQLQRTTPEQITNMIFDLYAKIMRAYLDQKELIPANQLMEMAFEAFENDPIKNLEEIYQHLHLDNWQDALPYFEDYLRELGGYEKNVYKISKSELERVKLEWGFAFDQYGYKVPENLEIV
jgi:hypothetical protein